MAITVGIFKPTVVRTKDGKKVREKSPFWQLRWRCPNTRKRMSESTGTKSKDAARTLARRKEEELLDARHGIQPKRITPTTLADAKKQFLDYVAKTNRETTAAAYGWSLSAFLRLTNAKRMTDISTKTLMHFVAARRDEVVAQTVNKDLRHVRCWLQWCKDYGLLADAPSLRGLFLRIDKKLPIHLTKAEMDKLAAAIPQAAMQPSEDWWRTFLAVLRYTGCRRCELLLLAWDQVDFEHDSLTILASTSKGRADRQLPIGPIRETLLHWRRLQGEPGKLVFPISSPNYFSRQFSKLAKTAGLRIVSKNFRSTCASSMAVAGESAFLVKEWLGHASVATTDQYYANARAGMADAAKRRGECL